MLTVFLTGHLAGTLAAVWLRLQALQTAVKPKLGVRESAVLASPAMKHKPALRGASARCARPASASAPPRHPPSRKPQTCPCCVSLRSRSVGRGRGWSCGAALQTHRRHPRTKGAGARTTASGTSGGRWQACSPIWHARLRAPPEPASTALIQAAGHLGTPVSDRSVSQLVRLRVAAALPSR